jgi:hypothetical protein
VDNKEGANSMPTDGSNSSNSLAVGEVVDLNNAGWKLQLLVLLTLHLTEKTIIHDFKPLEPGLRGILMPNGMIEPILGTRRVHLDVTNPFGGRDTIVLLDVQWAPGLKFNLLSENTAMKRGGRFEDSPYGGKLLYKPGERIPAVKCELDKGVHILKCKPQPVLESNPMSLGQLGTKVSVLNKEQYDATRLHRALGHPGRTTLINTLKGEHVTRSNVTVEAVKQLGSCESCLRGKQTRNFPRVWEVACMSAENPKKYTIVKESGERVIPATRRPCTDVFLKGCFINTAEDWL